MAASGGRRRERGESQCNYCANFFLQLREDERVGLLAVKRTDGEVGLEGPRESSTENLEMRASPLPLFRSGREAGLEK